MKHSLEEFLRKSLEELLEDHVGQNSTRIIGRVPQGSLKGVLEEIIREIIEEFQNNVL